MGSRSPRFSSISPSDFNSNRVMHALESRNSFLRYPWFATFIFIFILTTNYRFGWFISCCYDGKKDILRCHILFISLVIYEMLFRFGSLYVSWHILLPFMTKYCETFLLPVMFLERFKQNAKTMLVETYNAYHLDIIGTPFDPKDKRKKERTK